MGGTSGEIRVLHVDDEADFATLTAQFLEREDERFEVTTAGSADEGLRRLEEGAFDCVVSDYDMPDGNGIAFLEAVREEYPELPFVLFTGKGSEAVASDAISAGVTDYLQKESGTGQYAVLANRIENAVGQYRTERALAETERRFRRLIEAAADVITVVDPGGQFEYVSPAVERVLGYTAEEVTGTNAFDYVHPDDHETAVEEFRALVSESGATTDTEYRFENADGEWVWLEVRGRNLLDDPAVEGAVVYARDITERKRRERELERTNDRLEGFASVVSHDLRNPLNVASGRIDLAREQRDGEHLAAAAEAVARSEELVEDLLALARQGDAVGDPEPVDLADHVRACWRTVATGEATLHVDADAAVVADPSRLGQLLENLLGNAATHGGDAPRIEVDNLDGGFYVADDGPGVPPEDRERVFRSGYSTADDGTGVGLAVVEEVADAHGWDVTVTDGAAGGARFEVTGVDRPEG